VKEILQRVVRSAREVLDADSAVIWSYDDVRHTFVPDEFIWDNIPEELVEAFRYSEPRPGGTAETVMRDGCLTVTDIDDPQYAGLGSSDLGLREAIEAKSFQGVALQVSDETLGVLYVNYRQPRNFSPEEQTTLKAFANHAALELKKARLVEQLHRTHEAASIVAQVTVQENLPQALETIAQHTQTVLKCDAVSIYSYNEDKQLFGEWVVTGANRDSARPPEQRKQDSSIDTILNCVQLYEYAEDEAPQHPLLAGEFVRAENIRAALAIRLEAGGCRVGVLFVNFRSRHRFSTNEIETIKLFANQAAVAIRNAQLHAGAKKRAEALEGLYDAGQTITSTLTLDDTLQRLTEQALHIV